MRIRDIKPSGGNVFADLLLDAPDHLRAKAMLMSQAVSLVAEKKLNQTEAAKLLGIAQPRVSALMNGKLSKFSTAKLMEFLTALGNDVEIVVRKRSKRRGPGASTSSPPTHHSFIVVHTKIIDDAATSADAVGFRRRSPHLT